MKAVEDMQHLVASPQRSRITRRYGFHISEPTNSMAAQDSFPNTWQIDDDLVYGEQLLEEFKPFVMHLLGEEKLARSTVRRHLNHLFLFGGELISQINTYDDDRRLSPARLLENPQIPVKTQTLTREPSSQ